jgi:hypothetical protein
LSSSGLTTPSTNRHEDASIEHHITPILRKIAHSIGRRPLFIF